MPEAHNRLTVTPGTVSGRPASSEAMRATLRLSFAGLIGTSEHDLVNALGVDSGIAFKYCF
jgi:hypothetical protein